jgi:hypothetical protein
VSSGKSREDMKRDRCESDYTEYYVISRTYIFVCRGVFWVG